MQETTIVVQFGTDTSADAAANAHLSAEIDSREDGLNGGNTRFAPGDTAYFLVYKSDNVTLSSPISSAGTVSFNGTTSVPKEEEVVFAGTNEARLRVPAAGGLSNVKWLGNTLGNLSVNGATGITASEGGEGKAGVAKLTYTANATIGALSSPASIDGETDFSIVALIIGNVAGSAVGGG
jgi:hypothetical protein